MFFSKDLVDEYYRRYLGLGTKISGCPAILTARGTLSFAELDRAVSAGVRAFSEAGLKPGDRIIIPAVTNCGKCSYCRNNQPSHCQTLGGVGWVPGGAFRSPGRGRG